MSKARKPHDDTSSQCPATRVCAHSTPQATAALRGGALPPLAAPPHCLLIHPVLFHQPGTPFPYPSLSSLTNSFLLFLLFILGRPPLVPGPLPSSAQLSGSEGRLL